MFGYLAIVLFTTILIMALVVSVEYSNIEEPLLEITYLEISLALLYFVAMI